MSNAVAGQFAEKARKQRQTANYKEWRAAYEKTEKFRNRVRAYQAKRRSNPVHREEMRGYYRKSAEKRRINILVRHAILRCRKSGMPFDAAYLSKVALERPTRCPCCSIPLSYEVGTVPKMPKFDGPSLDRIDTLKGYVAGNVAIICWRCNALKRDATLAELERIVKYMREHPAL